MFPVTITLHDASQLNAVLNALSGNPQPQENTKGKPAAAPKAASGQATATAGAAPTKTAAAPTPAAESAAAQPPASTAATEGNATPAVTSTASPSASSAPSSSSEALSYEPVGKAITTFAARNGRDATVAKLSEFGVKSGKELKPEQYAAALEAFGA